MVTIRVEDVTEQPHRDILTDLLEGGFLYTAEGGQVDEETFEIELRTGEYGVVMDEILTESHDELVTADSQFPHRDIYNAFPKTVNVEENDSFTVSLSSD